MVGFLKRFLALEAASGLLLLLASLMGLAAANSPFHDNYLHFLSFSIAGKPLTYWINDGFMAIFFLLIGMEVKREITIGALSTRKQAALPAIAALGGVIVPAIIFSVFNRNSANLQGWAIPTATDIAFSLGVIALLGKRVPFTLKIFLMALAVIDDIAAISIIALFYTTHISCEALALAAACALIMLQLNRKNIDAIPPYIIIGIVMWLAMLSSGIHPTIAGVAMGLLIPSHTANRMIEKLHPWVANMIMPVFAFANAGVSLSNFSLNVLFQPLSLGIILGLFAGKPIGIVSFSYIAVKCRIASLPAHVTWFSFLGIAAVGGIGFTMSLFIGELSFAQDATKATMRIAIFIASLLSGISGYAILLCAFYKKPSISRS